MLAHYHLPGLFEFYEFYRELLQIYRDHKEYFYDWCDIGSIYGAPEGCIWGGGRMGVGDKRAEDVVALTSEYGISPRLTFSNSLLQHEHLSDRKCNQLCKLFEKYSGGVIVHSDILLDYLKANYPQLYAVSSTTKVQTEWDEFMREVSREEFAFVVPDFRINIMREKLGAMSPSLKSKVELLCNECCWFDCQARRECYENVSRKTLGQKCPDHICTAPDSQYGYRFSKAMSNPGFIGVNDVRDTYMPMGFTNFKIEGRGLGSALILEFILHYMVKPECQLIVREEMYLDNMLDLF